MTLREYLKENRMIPDGSMGTYYSELVNLTGAVSEYANLSAPEVIEGIHKEYLAAGAGILRTNTFAASRSVLRIDEKEQERLIRAACQIAKKAVADAGKESAVDVGKEPTSEVEKEDLAEEGKGQEKKDGKRANRVWIFGDIGPIPEDADTEEDEILKEYQAMCDIFLQEGLDGIHFETFSNLNYIEKLVPYIREKNKDTFLLASFSVNKNGYTSTGISAKRLLEKIGTMDGIDGCGLNCGIGSGHMYQILKRLAFPENKFIYAAPNAGYPEQMQNRMVFMDNARYFTDNMKLIAALGVDMIGGCCGTTPEYIRDLHLNIDGAERVSIQNRRKLIVEGKVKQAKENELCHLLHSGKKVIAVELDPPYDANIDQVMECAHKLKKSGADVITFADSPMGRSRVDSILMSIKIAAETGLKVMPHICCRDRNMISMRSTLLGAYIHGIRDLLIVTGDPVPGENRAKTTGVFDYNSFQLMDYVKEMNLEHFSEEPICYGGALNQGRGNLDKVIERMQRKIEAGASYFLTQPIYSAEDVTRIKVIKERTGASILCGIMPLVSYRNACFIKNEISGIFVPDEIVARYRPDMSREEAEQIGAEIAREMMEQLDTVADGYYFMLPFNRVSLMEKIIK